YDFTLDDFLPNQATVGSGLGGEKSPLNVVRKSRDQIQNIVKVEYLDRSNTYNPVTLEVIGRHFLLILELMALATVTEPGQGLFNQPVRITEIQENPDFSLTITAEEFLGTVSAPQFGTQPQLGTEINYNAAPGQVNAPILFEGTDELNQTNALGSLQI